MTIIKIKLNFIQHLPVPQACWGVLIAQHKR